MFDIKQGGRNRPFQYKELKSMVLCYKCFEEKHHDCMGKQGLFVCDCELCKKDSKAINNVMPESMKYVDKNPPQQ